MEEIALSIAEVQWAAEAARSSFSRWENQQGYYTNYLDSHFKGKLGEIAVEKFLLNKKLKLDSHFRFADRENLADIVVKVNRYRKIIRVEVKTWSANYWRELGRCIAVRQYPHLRNKADVIFWCLTDAQNFLEAPVSMKMALVGWSNIDDVLNAPVKFTGLDGMRKVENYQLNESDLRDIKSFSDLI